MASHPNRIFLYLRCIRPYRTLQDSGNRIYLWNSRWSLMASHLNRIFLYLRFIRPYRTLRDSGNRFCLWESDLPLISSVAMVFECTCQLVLLLFSQDGTCVMSHLNLIFPLNFSHMDSHVYSSKYVLMVYAVLSLVAVDMRFKASKGLLGFTSSCTAMLKKLNSKALTLILWDPSFVFDPSIADFPFFFFLMIL